MTPILHKIFKENFVLLLLLALSVNSVCPAASAKDTADTVAAEHADVNTDAVAISAKSAVLIDNTSGRILYAKSCDTEVIPASITKIMTLLLIFEAIEAGQISLEDTVTVSEYASQMGGSQVYLEAGETQTVNDLIKCISIASANDAAVAMAEYTGGSETAFVQMMNDKAADLGMVHTRFQNCNGLDDTIESGHYSSAYDVAVMSRELITKYPQISNYSTVWMDEITHQTKKGQTRFGLTNTNKLIRTYDGITGLKTGSTSKAKYCLSATASRNNVSLTAVVMAAPDHKVRFTEAAALLDYGFANCTGYTEKAGDITLEDQKISGALKETIAVRAEENFSYTLTFEESAGEIRREVSYDTPITAPVAEGEQVGTITYYLRDEKIGSLPVRAAETLEKAAYLDYLMQVLKRFLLQE